MEADEGPPGEPGAQKEKTVVYQHENKPRVDQRYVLFKQMRNKVSAHSLRSHSVHFSFNAGALCQIFDSGFIFLSFFLFFVFDRYHFESLHSCEPRVFSAACPCAGCKLGANVVSMS